MFALIGAEQGKSCRATFFSPAFHHNEPSTSKKFILIHFFLTKIEKV
jgi:hypothetical protein